MTTNRQPQGVLWVCVGCLLAREGDGPTEPCGCGPEHVPWALAALTDVTCGVACDDPAHRDDEHHDEHTEQCETRNFSWSPCDGCGCPLGGERHAYTWWE